MKFRNILTFPFDAWYRPILYFVSVFPLFILSVFVDSDGFKGFGAILFMTGQLGLLISTLVLLFKRQWKYSLVTFLVIIGSFLIFALLGPAIAAD